MEIFDIVNEKDEVIGSADRDKCHSDPGLIHRTAHFTLIDKKKKKILLTQRSFKLKTDPGKLCFAGEHLYAGENYVQGVIRGVQEELGFTPKIFKEVCHRIIKFPNQTEFARFFVVEWSREKIDYDKEEIIDIKWLDPETLARGSHNYSEIAEYWVKNSDWFKILDENIAHLPGVLASHLPMKNFFCK